MRISKLMIIAICCIVVLGAAVLFSFDVFKAYALLGFILAVDTQIVMAVKAMQQQAILEMLKESPEDKDDGSKDS